jgi:hypothetical protein
MLLGIKETKWDPIQVQTSFQDGMKIYKTTICDIYIKSYNFAPPL